MSCGLPQDGGLPRVRSFQAGAAARRIAFQVGLFQESSNEDEAHCGCRRKSGVAERRACPGAAKDGAYRGDLPLVGRLGVHGRRNQGRG
ncbi:hypothetical protein G6F68_021153 [Rhizopus microsporus]|nr:hypothetical protein G6F31_019875 [Rhizopus arrhizus]KAG1220602.1 hypothetical protein G6F68_021153 [Rhizopus microsporus]